MSPSQSGRFSAGKALLATALVALIVLIVGGFLYFSGDSEEKGDRDGERAGMVHIQDTRFDYFIDRYEFPNQAGVKPHHMFNLTKASKACAGVGKRLCTDAEWRRACHGPDGKNLFSYGPDFEQDACNNGKRLASGHSGMVDEQGKDIAPSGSMARCKSAEGVFDMVGNMEEWVLSSWQGGGGALEGGAWFTYSGYATCSGRYSRQPNYRFNPTTEIFSAGFRCCWSQAAPTEAALTRADLARDTRDRVAAAPVPGARDTYQPDAEAEVAPGLWFDLYEYPNRAGSFPRVLVTYKEAEQACQAAGKRICTTTEWIQACGGPRRWPHPVGEQPPPWGTCPSGLVAPVPAGSNRLCGTPMGLMEMLGGVWEWSATSVAAPPHVYPEGTVLRQVLGGSWINPEGEEKCTSTVGYAAVPQGRRYPELGFRCCRGEQKQAAAVGAVAASFACPDGMVSLGEFCVDRFEHPNKVGHIPESNLTYQGATAACASRGLHVCTKAEWERACGGAQQRAWTYGDAYQSSRCNYALIKPRHQPKVFPSGAAPTCVSPEGVFDLSGNVWEWITLPDGGGQLRGGGLNVSAGYGNCASTAHSAPDFYSFETGVRCCADAAEAAKLATK